MLDFIRVLERIINGFTIIQEKTAEDGLAQKYLGHVSRKQSEGLFRGEGKSIQADFSMRT
jgi:hypothetical protein